MRFKCITCIFVFLFQSASPTIKVKESFFITTFRLVSFSMCAEILTNRDRLFNIKENNNKQTPHQTRKNKFSIRSLQHPWRQTKLSDKYRNERERFLRNVQCKNRIGGGTIWNKFVFFLNLSNRQSFNLRRNYNKNSLCLTLSEHNLRLRLCEWLPACHCLPLYENVLFLCISQN